MELVKDMARRHAKCHRWKKSYQSVQ
jgi:hypothetical protein